ncbi:hypothetical protein ABPG72_000841 [Tetrahymena utriculariae]
MQQQGYKNSRQSKKTSPNSNKKCGQKVYQLQHPNSYDDQLSSILFSESQYSNKKPSKNKVYHTPEKKYDQLTQKKVPPQQYQMFQIQNNQIFGFNSHPLLEDRGQRIGEYKWHLPQRQQFPLQNQETNKKYFNQNSFQQEQNSNAGGEEQHSYIPSDNSSNIFDSMKSFSHSFNQGNIFNQQSSPFKNEQHFTLSNNFSTNQQNQVSQEAQYQSLNKGFTQSSSEGQLDSTDQIIKNMRADLLQVDFDMKKIIPNSNVQVICEDEPPQNFISFSQNDYNPNLFNNNKQNNEGYLYHSSHVSPVDQEPSVVQDPSKRESFNDISNLQIQINHKQNQLKMSEQSKYQENNTLRFVKQNQNNQDSYCENLDSSQRKQKKQGYDPIYMDIIQNIEASKQYLSCTQKCLSQQKEQKKQIHIYESILDENENKKTQKQINSAQKSTSQPKYSSAKKQSSYYSTQVLDSIKKKRQRLLQSSAVNYGKSQSPKLIHNQSLGFLNQSPTARKKNNSIESKLSLLKDLTQRHIQNLPLTSHLSSLKKQSQSPNQKNSRSGFEVCTFLKDPSGKSLIRPESLEKAIQANHNKPIVGSGDFKQRYKQELNQAKQKLQNEEKLSLQLDSQILQFNEDQKNIRQLILQTDSKVNKLEIRNKKLKSKWVEQGLSQELISDQDSKLQRLRDQEQKNKFIISELQRYNGDMKIQLDELLKQIEIEKSIKTQLPSSTKKNQNTLLQDESQFSQIKMLENTNSLNNTLSLPSSPFTIIGGSFSVKNQLQQNKNVNMQFNQCPKSDDSLNNIVGNSFDQQDQMISHLIQKYSPSPKKSQAIPSQSSQTVNTCTSYQSENKYKPQNTTQIKSFLQSRGLHDIMEEPSDDSKNSFLPLVNYQK